MTWLFYAPPRRCTCGEGLIDRYCSPSLIHYRFQLGSCLQHQTCADLTAPDGGDQLLQVRDLADVRHLIDQAPDMDRKPAAVNIVCFLAKQVEELGKYEELIMKLAANQNGSVTRDNVVDLLGINPSQAYRVLKKLTEKGKLKLVGSGLIDRYCSPSLIHYRFQEVSMQAILDQIADWL